MVCESPSGLALGRAGCRLAAVSHRPDGQGREDDVRGDGMHRRCETDGDDRHQQIKIERGELAAERARAIERAGGVSERCEANREIRRSNGELVDVLPPSEAEDYSVTVSRGCADSNAGCWAGGNALGDMQFAGTGTATGSWPYRNSYTTGNKSGQITFAINGVTYTPVAAGPWMRIATADGSGVDGVSVTRW